MMKESELIERVKENDDKAFKIFYEIYKDMVYNICFRMLNNRQDAEDITQDVFIKAIKSIHKFRGDSKLSTWIYQIAVNTSLNYIRRKKIEMWISLDFLVGKEESFKDTTHIRPDFELEKKESEALVQQAIQTLPPRQRMAIILQRYEGLSYKKIAKVMKTSISAVESLLHHAKDNLTKKLTVILK